MTEMSLEKLNFTAVQFQEDGTIFFTTTKKIAMIPTKSYFLISLFCSSMIMIYCKYQAIKSNFKNWKKNFAYNLSSCVYAFSVHTIQSCSFLNLLLMHKSASFVWHFGHFDWIFYKKSAFLNAIFFSVVIEFP